MLLGSRNLWEMTQNCKNHLNYMQLYIHFYFGRKAELCMCTCLYIIKLHLISVLDFQSINIICKNIEMPSPGGHFVYTNKDRKVF